ncbi:hypothetical protein [Leifsonia sp. 71-9]|uniref:hypothetical protein n=1 Tax=Leifsonia sp. 71-9 TaxID=1895934 RepID=UPI0025BE79C4|nr:hypothetical protein [Leifsonia sp. 71-9]
MMTPTPIPAPTGAAFVAITGDGIATIIAAILAAMMVVIGYRVQQSQTRKASQAAVYAEAIRAIHDYLEAPYRVRRRDGRAASRLDVTNHVSDVQSRIAYYRTLLQLHAPEAVSVQYDQLIAAARSEAGPQMSGAWAGRPTRADKSVPLGTPLPHPKSDEMIEQLILAMKG